MRVQDIMTRDVFTLPVDSKLDVVDELMRMEMIRHIPVVDHQNQLQGLVTHQNLLKASVSSFSDIDIEEKKDFFRHILIKEIMIEDVLTTTPETPIAEAAQVMVENKVGCLPVMRGEKIVGIVTEADFLNLIAHQPPELCF